MKPKNIIFLLQTILCADLAFGFSNLIIFNHFWVDGWAYPSLLIIVHISVIVSYVITLHYKLSSNFNIFQILFNILELTLFLCLFVLIYWVWVDSPKYYKLGIALFFLFFIIIKFFADKVYVGFLRKNHNESQNSSSILIGENEYSQRLYDEILENQYLGYRIKSTLKDIIPLDKLEAFIVDHEIESVFINMDMVRFNEQSESAIRQMAENLHVRFFSFSEIYSNLLKRGSYILIGKMPVIPLFQYPLDNSYHSFSKRLFDIFVSLFVVCFILSWLTPLVAIFIFMQSRGPIFYIHERIGKNNKPFKCFKFRTMNPSDKNTPFQQTVKNDPRVFPFGLFLRKTNIDELPQFINSLLGDISIVGPRPMMLGHMLEYDHEISEMYSRHLVKPGITGLAQVTGYRGEIDGVQKMRGRIRMDRYYLQNWSFLLDIKIIWWTIRNILNGDENAI